jgi:hypothetical protein
VLLVLLYRTVGRRAVCADEGGRRRSKGEKVEQKRSTITTPEPCIVPAPRADLNCPSAKTLEGEGGRTGEEGARTPFNE